MGGQYYAVPQNRKQDAGYTSLTTDTNLIMECVHTHTQTMP